MLIETGAVELMQQVGHAEQLVSSTLDVALRESPQPQEAFFEDREINAVLDMSRTAARLIILVTVVAAFGYWTYAMYLLMSAGDESRRLERCREVIWNVVKGLVLGVCSYLISQRGRDAVHQLGGHQPGRQVLGRCGIRWGV